MSPTRLAGLLERTAEGLHRVATRLESPRSGPAGGRLRPTSGGGLLVVVASVAVSLAAATALGSSVRIRWSVGTYYGPEHAPTHLALTAFPAVVAVTYLGVRALATGLEGTAAFDRFRGYYELCALAGLATLVLAQVAFVVANLW